MQKRKLYLLIAICVLSFYVFPQQNYLNRGMKRNYAPNIPSGLELSGEPATFEWVRIYDDPDPSKWDEANDVAIDSLGNIYSVGYSNGGMILVKYNSTGDYILNRTWFPGSGFAKADEVVLDSSNNIYVAGRVNSREDICLLKYDSDCKLQWVRVWDGSPNDFLIDIAKDSLDNIYLTGSTENISLGTSDMVVIKYDSSGNQLWNRTWGGLEGETGNSIAIDSSDNIIIGGTNSEGGDLNMILLKYNNLGVLQWDIEWERSTYWERNEGVVIDSTDNIYAAVIDIDNYIPILVKFDNFGNEIWNRTYQGEEFYSFDEMEIDPFDNIYLAATFEYRSFGFAKINKFGDFLWKETWGTADDEFCTSLALNSTKHIYLAGYRSFHSWASMILVKFKLNPPDIPYFTDLQENFAMYKGDISKSLVWTPIDESMFCDSYWIMKNETKVIEREWDGSKIFYPNLDELVPGIYNFTCFVNNTYGKLNSSSIIVSIIPNLHAPNINKNTNDVLLNIGTSNFAISWHAIDLDGNNNSYSITRNSSIIESGTWNNDSNITFVETEILDGGYYNYTCFVNDTSGLKNQSSIFITIINHDPSIINNTQYFIANFGTNGYLLSWHVSDSDDNTLMYWIDRNGEIIDSGPWVNNSDIDYVEIDFLSLGLYNYTCFINDTAGAINQSSIFVKINSYPYFSDITVPINNIYSPNMDYFFNCSFFDDDGMIEEVYFEFSNHNYTVTSNYLGEYTYTLSELGANENGYDFRWHAKDNDGAWRSTDWQIFILYKREVQLKILFNGTEDNYFYENNPLVNITVINLNSTSGNMRLYSNGKLIQEENNYMLVNLSLYLDGIYNITAILIDENYTANAMKWLNIREIEPPEIYFEFNQFYLSLTQPEYYHDEIQIICTVVDFSPLSWVYYCENSSGIFVNRSMTNLGNGNWTYTMDISSLNWNDVISFSFYANDTKGNIGMNDNSTELYEIQINDFQKPVTTLNFIPYEGVNVIRKSTLLSLTSNDNLGSGISIIRYKINNSDWYQYNTPFNFSTYEEGYYDIFFYAVDVEGNIEDTKSFIIQLKEISQEPPPDQAIPGFNIFIVLTIIGLGLFYLIKKEINLLY